MCGESWLAIKDLQPTVPVLKAGHPSVLVLCLYVLFVCGVLGLGFLPFFSSLRLPWPHSVLYIFYICIHGNTCV